MNELEAAEKLAALLNEIQAEGYEVSLSGSGIWVEDTHLLEPVVSEQDWEVQR